MQKSIYGMIYIIKIYIMIILCFSRFLVFGHRLEEPILWLGGFPSHFYIHVSS